MRVNVDEEPGLSCALRRPLAPDCDPLRRRASRRRPSTAHSRERDSSASSRRTCDGARDQLGRLARGRGDRVLGRRAARASRRSSRFPTTSILASLRPSSRPASRRSSGTRPRRGKPRSAARTSSSPPARRRANPSRSTSPFSTRSHAIRRHGRSTSTRRRRSRRIRRDRSRSSGSRASGPRSTTATRRPSDAGRSASGRTLVLTNPDMLHVGVLPHHDRWGDVLANLRYVVVDEAHVYRGVFGSHVANVLRRLRRLARIYDAEPQFLLASATIANAGELAFELTGEAATVVDNGHLGPRRARGRHLESPAPRRGARAARELRSATPRGSSPSSPRADCGRSASRRAARQPS